MIDRRPRGRSLALALCVFAVCAPAASAANVFGPATYAVEKDGPRVWNETFAVSPADDCDGRASWVLAVQNGDDGGRDAVSSATISLNGVELFRERDFNGKGGTMERPFDALTANALRLEIKTAAAGNRLTLTVRRVLDAESEAACSALRVTIDSPADGGLITSPRLTVTGTLIGPLDASVRVGTAIARVDTSHAGTSADPFRWFASVEAEPGPVTLNARAADGLGRTATATATATYAPAPSGLSLIARLPSGIAPFEGLFGVDSTLPEGSTFSIDFNGDGIDELTNVATLPDPLQYTYAAPGMYEARIRSGTATASALVVVQSFASVDLVTQMRWKQLADALAAGDIDAAAALFASGNAKRKYREVFTKLATELPRIGAGMAQSIPRAISVHADYADYIVTRVENGRTMGYHLSMLRDANGVWKIADL